MLRLDSEFASPRREQSRTFGDADLYGESSSAKVGRNRADSVGVRKRVMGEVKVHGLNTESAEWLLRAATTAGPGGHLFYRDSTSDDESLVAMLAVRGGAADTLVVEHIAVEHGNVADDGNLTTHVDTGDFRALGFQEGEYAKPSMPVAEPGRLFWLRPLPMSKFQSLEDLRQHYKRTRAPPLPNRLTVTVDPATVDMRQADSAA